MLARIVRLLCTSIALAAMAWLVVFWPSNPLVAVGGSVAIVFGFSGVLVLQFVVVYAQGRLRPDEHAMAILPTPWQLLRAWCVEVGCVLQAYCWWQAFRATAQPDWLPAQRSGRRGVVLVHGFVCNRAVWMPWFARLRAQRHAYIAVNLEPVWGSIDAYVPLIDDAVRRVTQATGLEPVLVCHSMGGLVARAWLRAQAARGEAGVCRVERVITIGSPHHGTWLARLNRFHFSENAAQMQQDSPWLQRLAQDEAKAAFTGCSPDFTCFYSHCDNIVFPLATATLAGADNRHVPGVAHLAMALDQGVIAQCMALIAPVQGQRAALAGDTVRVSPGN